MKQPLNTYQLLLSTGGIAAGLVPVAILVAAEMGGAAKSGEIVPPWVVVHLVMILCAAVVLMLPGLALWLVPKTASLGESMTRTGAGLACVFVIERAGLQLLLNEFPGIGG